jgi:hypothetical protein
MGVGRSRSRAGRRGDTSFQCPFRRAKRAEAEKGVARAQHDLSARVLRRLAVVAAIAAAATTAGVAIVAPHGPSGERSAAGASAPRRVGAPTSCVLDGDLVTCGRDPAPHPCRPGMRGESRCWRAYGRPGLPVEVLVIRRSTCVVAVGVGVRCDVIRR